MAGRSEALPQRPAHTVRIGAVEAAVWENQRKDGLPFYTVTFKRSYKDESEGWKESASYGERDCATLARAALDAQAWIGQQMRGALIEDRAS